MDHVTSSTRRGATWPAALSAVALVLAAAVLAHLGMLLRPAHPTIAPAGVAAAPAAHEAGVPTHDPGAAAERGDGTRVAHLMLAACLVVISVVAAAGAPGRSHDRLLQQQPGRRGRGWVAAGPAHRPRGPTRVDAGVVLRV